MTKKFIYRTWRCTTCADRGNWEHTMGETSSEEFANLHIEMTGHTVVETKWTPIEDAT